MLLEAILFWNAQKDGWTVSHSCLFPSLPSPSIRARRAEHARHERDVPQLRGDAGQHGARPWHDPGPGGHRRCDLDEPCDLSFHLISFQLFIFCVFVVLKIMFFLGIVMQPLGVPSIKIIIIFCNRICIIIWHQEYALGGLNQKHWRWT